LRSSFARLAGQPSLVRLCSALGTSRSMLIARERPNSHSLPLRLVFNTAAFRESGAQYLRVCGEHPVNWHLNENSPQGCSYRNPGDFVILLDDAYGYTSRKKV